MPKEEKEQISQRNPLSVAVSGAGASGWKPSLSHQRMCCKVSLWCKRNCGFFVSETPLSFVQKQADRQSDNGNNKKQRGRHALQRRVQTEQTAQRGCANSFIATLYSEK